MLSQYLSFVEVAAHIAQESCVSVIPMLCMVTTSKHETNERLYSVADVLQRCRKKLSAGVGDNGKSFLLGQDLV